MKRKYDLTILFVVTCSPLLILSNVHSSFSLSNYHSSVKTFKFNATLAYDFIQKQVDLGSRYPGSEGIEEVRHLIASELLPTQNWVIIYQNFSKKWDDQDVILVNIICTPISPNFTQPFFLLMAHYDTRLWADKDPDLSKRKEPVLGANDGASGVAIALELGKTLFKEYNYSNFQLVFFDGEDQGQILGWDWLLGSRFYVESQEFKSQNLSFAILLDMVAGKNATFKREKYSDQYAGTLVTKIWNEADKLGFNKYFINQTGSRIIDDHLPLIENDIPAVDIIDDFVHRFKPWHTSFDNMTFIDMHTINAVGLTLESTLIQLLTSEGWLTNLTTINYQTNFLILNTLNFFILLASVTSRCKKRLIYRYNLNLKD
ncbi:MAG: M28 family peptidase [Candidatus Heimdallarchaeota archaeon]|nr:MAG: M28 family peptidase [Candidatus Heimdallarchaeota archaeon]